MAAVSGIGIGSIAAIGVAGTAAGVAFAGQSTENIGIDGKPADGDRVTVTAEDLAAQRGKLMENTSRSVAEREEEVALDVRQADLKDAAKAVGDEAERLRNLENFLWPTAGNVGSPFGRRYHPILHYYRLHDGDDIGGKCGQPIYAAQTGTVIKAAMGGYNGGSGNNVRIDHGDINGHSVQTAYLHMSKIIVKVGDVVNKGQQIGNVGSTGLSTACHLHLALYKDGRGTDPQEYLTKPARTDAEAIAALAAGKPIPAKKDDSGASETAAAEDPTVD